MLHVECYLLCKNILYDLHLYLYFQIETMKGPKPPIFVWPGQIQMKVEIFELFEG